MWPQRDQPRHNHTSSRSPSRLVRGTMHNLLPWRYIGALSIAFILVAGLLLAGFTLLAGHYLRLRNPSRRMTLLDELAKSVGGGSAERLSLERKKLVGFFHPYWYVRRFQKSVGSSGAHLSSNLSAMPEVVENACCGVQFRIYRKMSRT